MARDATTVLKTLDPSTHNHLMNFFRTKKQIAEAANELICDDIDEDEVHYSSFTRALEFEEIADFVVDKLDELDLLVGREPRRYLPDAPPDDIDDLRAWIKQFAPAPWWVQTLDLESAEIKASSFNQWLAGRPMGKAKVDATVERLHDWWARLMQAVEQVEYVRWVACP